MDVEDDGTVTIASSDAAGLHKAIEMVQNIAAEPEIGKIYNGTVRKVVDFGAFVEILPGTDGLVHISQLSAERVQRVSDVLNEGDQVRVKVLEVDRLGKIRLSRKDALQDLQQTQSENSSDNLS
jgi:polyribonucleotide nucleotidyltransferase